MRPTPLLPASKACHTASVVFPTPQIRPMPVTTTLRPKLLAAFRMLADVIDGILHGADLLRVLVGNLDVEAFLERHYQFHGVQRIRAQVVYKRGAGSNLALIHAQLLYDDLLYLFVNGCHVSPRLIRFDLKFDVRMHDRGFSGCIQRVRAPPILTSDANRYGKRRTCSVTVRVNGCKGSEGLVRPAL